jgi:type I restriction-modification system DNA methylase subunit
MSAPNELVELVTRFKENLTSYKNPNYNETQVRREFIDPLFGLLGWDVANKEGYAEAYKEVIHEYSQKTKDSSEAPDYLFRIGGIRKFFVEAKKPSVNLKDDPNPAFQVRRYAWSAKLPLSILTDFEEFIVYDCRIKPVLNDKPSNGRILYYTFEDYIIKWDEIYSVFSREAVLKGSFDRFADSKRNKKGTAEVDDEFLSEIENWREHLAKNLALRNPELSSRELNFAVQKTIDRIIFLRICEDRGIEDYGQLLNLLNGANIYKRLLQIFTAADQKYNSGLFYFDQEKNRSDYPDTISHKLNIDDKTLKDIIKKLYYPESPYEFSVLPADILGHVYEQFLGKVIRLTAGHRAIVEEKPEVKKAGGVYYTPTYIVEYIVKNTLGVKLDEINSQQNKLKNKIDETSKLKVLDPACGSGSFLLGAYQYLLDWHLKLYSDEYGKDNFIPKKESPVYKAVNNELKLTTAEKKRILLNNIFGVDIDSQAVEVTKLSLMLKVLEGETGETLNTQMSMFRQRALPDLGNNIKCGNSLIGPDFYDQMEMNFLDDEGKYKINVFDWHSEFKEIFNNDGFDVVIGNPPWVDIKGMNKIEVDYYFRRYKTTENRMNIYATFIEANIERINTEGILGFIIPNSILYQSSFTKLRSHILLNYRIHELVRLPDNTFKNVKAESLIIVVSKNFNNKLESIVFDRQESINKIDKSIAKDVKLVDQNMWLKHPLLVFDIFSNEKELELIEKIETNKPKLIEFCEFSLGITPYDKYRGQTEQQIKERVFHSNFQKDETYKPLLEGANVNRYFLAKSIKEYLSYGDWLGAPRERKFFQEERILIRQIVSGKPLRIFACRTTDEFYNTQSIFNLVKKEKSTLPLSYILGLINSRLMNFYHSYKFLDISKNLFQKILIQNCKNFPIVLPSNEQQEKITLLVATLTGMKNKEFLASTPQEKQTLQRQIEATDKQMDKLVYELYGLTEEEIKIVEESK